MIGPGAKNKSGNANRALAAHQEPEVILDVVVLLCDCFNFLLFCGHCVARFGH